MGASIQYRSFQRQAHLDALTPTLPEISEPRSIARETLRHPLEQRLGNGELQVVRLKQNERGEVGSGEGPDPGAVQQFQTEEFEVARQSLSAAERGIGFIHVEIIVLFTERADRRVDDR